MHKVCCRRCGHQWLARVAKPRACPACKSYRYDRPLKPAVASLGDHEVREGVQS
jgi:predicted Zn-ribbon and HTH transcriptional regulator